MKKAKKVLLIGSALLAGALALAGCVDTTTTTSQTPQTNATTQSVNKEETKSATKEFQEVKKISGKSNSDSETFSLSGGKVKMVAKTWGSTVGSFSSIELKSEEGGFLSGADLTITTEGSEEGNSETIVRNAEAGDYYISVISGISWEVTIYEEK